MKKILSIVMIFLFIVGCQSSSTNDDYVYYIQVKEQLMKQTHFDQEYPFQIQVVFNKLEDHYRYDVIIDRPQKDMYSIQAMAYSEESDREMCPVLGFFDDDVSHLKVDYVNKAQHFYKGIQLSGECSKKQTIKVYISYSLDEKQTRREEKYIEVKA